MQIITIFTNESNLRYRLWRKKATLCIIRGLELVSSRVLDDLIVTLCDHPNHATLGNH
jgi:hypothetical protein